jgi:rod shape-determining protein MreC
MAGPHRQTERIALVDTLGGHSQKPLFRRGPGLGLKALLLVFLSLTMILADHRTSALADVRAGLHLAVTPAIWLAQVPERITVAGRYFTAQVALEAENVQLREELLRARARTQRIMALESENRRLRELLASAAALEERVLVAEVLATNQDPYRHQITLNRGGRDGLYRGQALVDAHGVLGQVVRVLPTMSVALLVTDPDHGIPVEVNRTGLQTIAVGRGDGLGLVLPFLPGNADIRVGDLLMSSSLGGRFPSGYPVGEVTELRYQPGEHFMEAIALPAARINQGRQVLLVWSESFPIDEPDVFLESGP